jgi:hypothetical protein
MTVRTEARNSGIADALIVCCEGLRRDPFYAAQKWCRRGDTTLTPRVHAAGEFAIAA